MPATEPVVHPGELVQAPQCTPFQKLLERVFGAKLRRVAVVPHPDPQPIDSAQFREFQEGGLEEIREGLRRRGKRKRS
jgi:hypothetical protein